MLEQTDKDKKKERVRIDRHRRRTSRTRTRSRRATYTGDAHLNGPQGDMTADEDRAVPQAESGDELERAEAYERRQ